MMARSGRRSGESRTRDDILAAARKLFATNGIERSTIRAIAADANVDPALVHHYFGSKKQLFAAAVHLPVDPDTVTAPVRDAPLDRAGAAVVDSLIALWDGEYQAAALSLLRTHLTGPNPSILSTFFFDVALKDLVTRVDNHTGDGHIRVNLVVSQMVGIVVARYVIRTPPLVDASRSDLVSMVGPTIQHYLTGDLTQS